jgi:guanylate kinase
VIVTLTGPTCGGKTTLEAHLQAAGFGRVVSHTTREARPGEQCAVDYHFVNMPTFMTMVARGDFVETNQLGARFYGVSKEALAQAAAAGRTVLVVEPNGAKAILDHCRVERIPHLAVWVQCEGDEQARRWAARVDSREGWHEAVVERLGLMLGKEQCWRLGQFYNLRLDSTHMTPDSLAKRVIDATRLVP